MFPVRDGLGLGYQGEWESRYVESFCRKMGGGYGDAVSSGTAALFVGVRALGGGVVGVSPITDPGTLSAVILNGFKVRLIDSSPGSYQMGVESFVLEGLEDSGVVVVHSLGSAAPVDRISHLKSYKEGWVLEDCSQSHFATLKGRVLGDFGRIACFSTMYRKAHFTGGCGGVVWTKDLELHRRCLAHADRGKPRWLEGFDDRDPRSFLFPALNFHQDEESCKLGLKSLEFFDESRRKRLEFVRMLSERVVNTRFKVTYNPEDSPFALPVFVDGDGEEYGLKLREMGVPLNPRYRYLCSEWPWLEPYLVGRKDTPNAKKARDSSFVLYLNENYGEREADEIAEKMKAL